MNASSPSNCSDAETSILAKGELKYEVTEIKYTPSRTTVNSGETLTIDKVTAVWSNGVDSYEDSNYTNFSIVIGNTKANSTLNGNTIEFNTDVYTGGSTKIRIISKDNESASIIFTIKVKFMNV